jgi:hypothetical protein
MNENGNKRFSPLCAEFFIAWHGLAEYRWLVERYRLRKLIMSVPAKKRAASAPASKPTRGTVMAAKLRAQCNNMSDEKGETAYLHAMSVIYGATRQTARTGH